MIPLRDVDKINRQVFYLQASAYDDQAEYPKDNNTFRYHRAPEGYKFLLHAVHFHTVLEGPACNGIFEMSDGHYYTGWNIYPGVENREIIAYSTHDADNPAMHLPLFNWEAKEYTIGIRSTSSSAVFRGVVIVWYYLRRMNKLETLMYACIHPLRKRFRKGYATTVEPTEEE